MQHTQVESSRIKPTAPYYKCRSANSEPPGKSCCLLNDSSTNVAVAGGHLERLAVLLGPDISSVPSTDTVNGHYLSGLALAVQEGIGTWAGKWREDLVDVKK